MTDNPKKPHDHVQQQPGQHQQRTITTPTGQGPGYKMRYVPTLPPAGQPMDYVFVEDIQSVCVWDKDHWVCFGGDCYDFILDEHGGGTHRTIDALIPDIVALNTPGVNFINVKVCPGDYTVDADGNGISALDMSPIWEDSYVFLSFFAQGAWEQTILAAGDVYFPTLDLGSATSNFNVGLGMRNIICNDVNLYAGVHSFSFQHCYIGSFESRYKIGLPAADWCEVVDSKFDNCGFASVSLDQATVVEFRDCNMGVMRFTSALQLSINGDFLDDAANAGAVVDTGNFGAAVIIEGTFDDVRITANTYLSLAAGLGWHGLPSALVYVRTLAAPDLPAGMAVFSNRGIVVTGHAGEQSSSNRTTYIMATEAGTGTPVREALVQGNSFRKSHATATRGAIGPFQDSTFGPNAPDNLDYSGVSGTGNVFYTSGAVPVGVIGVGGVHPFVGALHSGDDDYTLSPGMLSANARSHKLYSDAGVTQNGEWDGATARLVVGGPVADATISIGGGPNSARIASVIDGAADTLGYLFRQHSGVAGVGPRLAFARSRGTKAAQTLILNNDWLGGILGYGHNGTDYKLISQIVMEMDGATAAGDLPTRLRFYTTPDGSDSPVERVRINNAGGVWLGNYMRVGALVVPTNTGTGDFTAARLIVPDAALLTGLVSQFGGPIGITAQGILRFYDTDNSNFIGIQADAARTTDLVYVLPATDPTAGQVLSASAPVAGVVTLSWVAAGGGGGSALTVQELDGAPLDAAVTVIKTPNGGLIDNGVGDVTLDYELGGAVAAHTGDAVDAHDASAISIVDAAGDFTATDVEGALAELQSDAEAHLSGHTMPGLAVHLPGTIDDGANQGNIERVSYAQFTAATIYCRFRVAPTFSANTHQIIVKVFNSADVQQGTTQTITMVTTQKTYTHTIGTPFTFPQYGYFTVEIEHSAPPTTKGADLSVAVLA